MPRETISDPNGSYDVRVGWHQDQGVQIGVADPEGRSLFWIMAVGTARTSDDLRLRRLGLQVTDALAKDGFVLGHEADYSPDEICGRVGAVVLDALDTHVGLTFESLWSDLDRTRCNRLIRLLRKARDSAFGRDE